MLENLLRPFAYLTIRHPTRLPLWVNWVLPGLFALIITVLVGHFDLHINLLKKDGLVDRILSFFQTLVGFYLAGLAAIASFNSRYMDKTMPGKSPPTMRIVYNGVSHLVNLTRRRFLCSMFAYLTACSFLITLTSITLLAFADPITPLLSAAVSFWIKNGLLFLYLLAVAQMTSVTFWGLYYMGERMLTPD